MLFLLREKLRSCFFAQQLCKTFTRGTSHLNYEPSALLSGWQHYIILLTFQASHSHFLTIQFCGQAGIEKQNKIRRCKIVWTAIKDWHMLLLYLFSLQILVFQLERLSMSNMREGRSMDNRWSINSNRYPNTSTYKEATIDFDKTMLKTFIAFTKNGVLHSV